MNGIGDIFKRLGKTLVSARENSSNQPSKGLTAHEVELNSFRERNRLDQVKLDLEVERKKHSMLRSDGDINVFKKQRSLLKGNTLLKKQRSLLKENTLLRNQPVSRFKNILDVENVFR